MDIDLSSFRADAPGAPKPKRAAAWQWTPIAPVITGSVLAFDQSLASTGWCHARVVGGSLTIVAVGIIATEASNKGHEGNLERAEDIHERIMRLISSAYDESLVIAHETPPVGGRMARPEASLLAALAVRIAARRQNLSVSMIGAQRVKKRFTGNGNADKALVREALDREFPIFAQLKPRNEHTYDAAGIACVAAEEPR